MVLQEVGDWKEQTDFQQSKNVVDHIMVVNDVAERAVQLASNLRDTVKYGFVQK